MIYSRISNKEPAGFLMKKLTSGERNGKREEMQSASFFLKADDDDQYDASYMQRLKKYESMYTPTNQQALHLYLWLPPLTITEWFLICTFRKISPFLSRLRITDFQSDI
jgi:hypothetical protein